MTSHRRSTMQGPRPARAFLLALVVGLSAWLLGLDQARATSYPGNGNSGFAGPVGQGSLEITNNGDTLTFALTRGPGDLNDFLVLYIDSVTGGFADTTQTSDAQDSGRAAISGGTTTEVTFGFDADYAIVFDAASGGHLFQLTTGGNNTLGWIADLGGAAAPTSATFTWTASLADLGLSPGDTFSFVSTYLNPSTLWRSDEAIGDGVAASTAGQVPITFTAGRTFASELCGDGVLQGSEVCDDGNTSDGDGCAADCLTVEAGWTCPVAGNPCTCAAGYYGASCAACPGGAATPCSDNGVCDDGSGGAGTCTCFYAYGGADCAQTVATPVLNEIRIQEPGTDNDEYFEIAGEPGVLLDGLTLIVIGDGAAVLGSGVVEAVVSLDGVIIPADGVALVAESSFTLGATPDLVTSLNFENDDNVTFLLVDGFTGANGDDLDTDDDGTLDATPWSSEIDRVALVEHDNPPTGAGNEYHYGPPQVGPDGANVPGHVQRCPSRTGAWQIAELDPAMATDETPGAPNVCPGCGDGNLDAGEACDDGSANSDTTPDACRTDCSLPACGDAVTDTGEQCDDGNTTAGDGCENDCTTTPAATCGDGNLDAGEACDDGSANSDTEPDACRTNCTLSRCGDAVTDTGEQCDDGNATAGDGCESDCTSTPATPCGNGTLDAGEACDDGAQNSDTEPDACRTDCSLPTCGDSVTDSGEVCDNGGLNSDVVPLACRTDCAGYVPESTADGGCNCTSAPGAGDGTLPPLLGLLLSLLIADRRRRRR